MQVATCGIAESYAEALAARLGGRLARISLFGSRARGDARFRSDYDLMIVLRGPAGADASA